MASGLLSVMPMGFWIFGSFVYLNIVIMIVFGLKRALSTKKHSTTSNKVVVAFFHPYCDNGGGGERVLWFMVYALLNKSLKTQRNLHIAIYSGDNSKSKEEILMNVKNKFNIEFSTDNAAKISMVNIQSRFLLEAKWYPVATMLFQSLGSMVVGLECLCRLSPDIFCDTIGAAFTYPLVKLLCGAKVVAYVHYPIISSDMLKKVREQRPSHNNSSSITSSVTVSSLKLLYYRLFASSYSFVGSFADEVMVNSSWTRDHIAELWGYRSGDSAAQSSVTKSSSRRQNGRRTLQDLHLVFPPCNTTDLLDKMVLRREAKVNKERLVVSIGQFRPEKDHYLQIRSLKALKDSSSRYDDVVLVIIGSTRHEEDRALRESLGREAQRLGLADSVRFEVNQPYSVLLRYMQVGVIGLHSMWNEHFGISIVEMMAAGLVVVAHNSGGPKMDIVRPPADIKHVAKDKQSTGFLAETPEQYAECMRIILDNYSEMGFEALKTRARESTLRFSDETFMSQVVQLFDNVNISE